MEQADFSGVCMNARRILVCLYSVENKERKKKLHEWWINFGELKFLGRKISTHAPFPHNSVLLELVDGYYTSKVSETFAEPSTEASVGAARPRSGLGQRSLDVLTAVRLLELKKELFMVQQETKELKERVEDRLELVRAFVNQDSEREKHKETIKELRDEYDTQALLLKTKKQELKDEERDVLGRGRALVQGHIGLLASNRQHEEDLEKLRAQSASLHDALLLEFIHKRTLIAQLNEIYPIEINDGSANTIAGLGLPDSDYTGCDEEHIAAALGCVCHILVMLSKFFEVPLRYRITPKCSRSSVRDDMSHPSGTSEFPLYPKGIDRSRFDYAVFLLNKNIEQMLSSQGFTRVSLRSTLPNLKLLLTGEGGETLHRVFAARVARRDDKGQFPSFIALRGALLGRERAERMIGRASQPSDKTEKTGNRLPAKTMV